MGTSLASVKEQRPVWNKRIERKQAQYDKAWDMAHSYAIRITNFVTFNSVPTDFDLYWKKPDFRSENDNAELLEQFSKGLGLLKSNKNMSDKEIYNTLNQFDFIKLEDTFEKHKKEVAKSENTDDNNSTEDVDGGNNDDNDDGENADE